MNSRCLVVMIACAWLAACGTPHIVSAPLPVATPIVPDLVQPGDVVELRFLRSPRPTEEPYRIGIGDQLRVNVFDHPELSQDGLLVLPDGYISLPLIQRMYVNDFPIEWAARMIAERYAEQDIRDPDVTVSVEAGGSRLRVFLESVASAGGEQGVQVPVEEDGSIALPALDTIRGNRNFGAIRRDIESAYEKAFGPELAVVVRVLPDDEVRLVHVIGEVVNPGPIPYERGMNAMMAVARAGGFLRSANEEQVRLYRYAADSGVTQWELDLEQSLEGEEHVASTLQIGINDVIFVPRTGIAVANDRVEQYIRNMLPTAFGFGISYGINQN